MAYLDNSTKLERDRTHNHKVKARREEASRLW